MTSRLQRLPAAQHLVDDDTEAPDVGACVDGFPARLFRRHVRDGAHDEPGLVVCARAMVAASGSRPWDTFDLASPKSSTFTSPSARIITFWLDVAMDDPGGVCGVQGGGDLRAI